MAGLSSLQPSEGSSGNQALAFCFFSSKKFLIEGVAGGEESWCRAVGGGVEVHRNPPAAQPTHPGEEREDA